MTYKEFKEKYNYCVSRFPETTNFYISTRIKDYKKIITCTDIHYIKKGSKWIETKTETHKITGLKYCDLICWLQNMWGKNTVTCNYTYYGYIPIELNMIAPDKTQKIVTKFKF